MNAAAPIFFGRALLALMLAVVAVGTERADAASPAHPDIATTLSPWRGRPAAPAIDLKTLDGAAWSLAALRGKVAIVNFWATWCEPCRDEMPSLLRLREQFAGAPLEVVAINYLDDEQKIREFLKVMPLAMTIVRDGDGKAAGAWRARALPSSYVVDDKGIVRYSVFGSADWTAAPIVAAIRQLVTAAAH